ncbi:hypothetical protein N658DRAFT_524146 [Parathielavia hyrcaniae]|uniref:Uncharacterized protein n=1 Tax=Parathielavia hyrcaniae TaxID=113614 RepID=A0AAN6T1Z4_9PEZI|nr:hypothetical protein N658DRAFT_524146 [Parathielavia hyrcaniae]
MNESAPVDERTTFDTRVAHLGPQASVNFTIQRRARRPRWEVRVCYNDDELEHHGHPDCSTSNSPERAVALVSLKSADDVSAIARIYNRRNVHMVHFAAGSSVEGNFSHMDKILAFHPDDMGVMVQLVVN